MDLKYIDENLTFLVILLDFVWCGSEEAFFFLYFLKTLTAAHCQVGSIAVCTRITWSVVNEHEVFVH